MASSSPLAFIRGLSKHGQKEKSSSAETPATTTHLHLLGLRGILVVLSFLWIFFQTFIPTVATYQVDGPGYQKVLRIVFSPLLWNESLISAFFLALSSRSIAVHFLQNNTSDVYAGSIIRRTVRLAIAVGISSFIAYGIFGGIGTEYISDFITALPNPAIVAPSVPDNALVALNSVFDIFWIVRGYHAQAANAFWPSATLWNVSLIYQQSWTVYFLMVLLPYGRLAWRGEVLGLFIAGAFWMCSWGWYSAAGLLLTDFIVTQKLFDRFTQGIRIKDDFAIPPSVTGSVMVAMGAAMKYVWAALPQYIDRELVLHPYLDLSENITRGEFARDDPFPRVDNFLVIFGLLMLVEVLPPMKAMLSANWLVALGKRSLSFFVAQSLVVYTAGIKLFLHLHTAQHVSVGLANLAVFVTCLVTVLVCSEVYYRAVDLPSQWAASWMYTFLTC